MAAVVQLQQDVCLMQTNLQVLNQYTLLLQGTASKLIEKSLGASDFPAAEVTAVPSALGFAALRSDGGDGAVAALAGSHTATLGWLVAGWLSYARLIFTILDFNCIYIAFW